MKKYRNALDEEQDEIEVREHKHNAPSHEEDKKIKHEEIKYKELKNEDTVEAVMRPIVVDEAELDEDDVLKDEVYNALKKLGLSDKALEKVVGVEAPEKRLAKRGRKPSTYQEYKNLTAEELDKKYTLGDAKRIAKELGITFKASAKELELWNLIKEKLK
jgi:2-hydroxychromene-2-carboxylate isomerase